jgi:hypothetical protein
MFKNYFLFLTTTSLLRFKNQVILSNNLVSQTIITTSSYLFPITGVNSSNLLVTATSLLGQRLLRLFYAFSISVNSVYRIRLKLVGNGYYLQLLNAKKLILFVGQSHLNEINLPNGLIATITGRKKRTLILTAQSRSLLQNYAAFLINLAYTDVYRLKGLRYVKQTLTKKEGKKKFV